MFVTMLAALVFALPPRFAVDTVDVNFRCPGGGQLYALNWDSERKGSYLEDGKSHDITFKGGGTGPLLSFSHYGVSRSGQTIRCDYRTQQGYGASYRYDVNREIISCAATSSYGMKCKLKESGGK